MSLNAPQQQNQPVGRAPQSLNVNLQLLAFVRDETGPRMKLDSGNKKSLYALCFCSE